MYQSGKPIMHISFSIVTPATPSKLIIINIHNHYTCTGVSELVCFVYYVDEVFRDGLLPV